MKIAYEPHPVLPDRKAELRAQGYRILDAKFAPQEALESAAVEEPPKPARGRPRGRK